MHGPYCAQQASHVWYSHRSCKLRPVSVQVWGLPGGWHCSAHAKTAGATLRAMHPARTPADLQQQVLPVCCCTPQFAAGCRPCCFCDLSLTASVLCRCGYVGEGHDVQIAVSPELIHPQITLYGVWVTSTGHMEDLLEQLVSEECCASLTGSPFAVRSTALGKASCDKRVSTC